MRIIKVRNLTFPISRYEDRVIPSGGLTTSAVAIRTDEVTEGRPIVGLGFASIGRFGQHGLIDERFAPRLLAAEERELVDESGRLDPVRAWQVMMRGEKAGGHGERCVAVGALEMALWDAAAKLEGLPLHELLQRRFAGGGPVAAIPVYASGGYRYPQDDLARLRDEMERFRALGYTQVKIKIGGAPLAEDITRLEAVLQVFSPGDVAVDAMNAYDAAHAVKAADALRDYGLKWFEDICDPHDFATHRAVAERYPHPIAVGEAIFSAQEAALLADHAGLRPDRDVLLFDPAHCYGVTGFARIVDAMHSRGWKSSAFWPHGGHIFSLHVASAFAFGGSEVNPISFAPFGGLQDGSSVVNGSVMPPRGPGVGFEHKANLRSIFVSIQV